MSILPSNSSNVSSEDLSQLVHHYDFMSKLIVISIATLLSGIFNSIGLILSLTVNRKNYSFEDDPRKHHITRWQLGLVIFILALLNDFIGIMEAIFYWTKIDRTFNSATIEFLRIFETNANLALFSFVTVACYHIKRCVYSNPQVVSFRFYLLVGFALPIIGVSLQYLVQFGVTEYTKRVSHSSRIVIDDPLLDPNQLDEIHAKINSLDAIYHLMSAYTIAMCIFCIINLVYIIIVRFKKQQKRSSNFVVNIFVVYFLIFSLTIPEIISWIATSIETIKNDTITGDMGVLGIIEASYDLLRGLALLIHELYLFWCSYKIKKSKTEIKSLSDCSVDNDTVKRNCYELNKE